MLITNFRNNEKGNYEKALKIYKKQKKDTKLYIDRNAYRSNGIKDKDMNALRCAEFENLSEFWTILNKIRNN